MAKITFETWRDVPGYKGYYKVSNIGRVKSLPRKGTPGKVLRPIRHRDGYERVSLWRRGVRKQVMIHRLVLTTFIGPYPPGSVTNHKNKVKDDNRLSNLEFVTPSENNLHFYSTEKGRGVMILEAR